MIKITQNSNLKGQSYNLQLKTKKLVQIFFPLKDKGLKVEVLSFELCLLS